MNFVQMHWLKISNTCCQSIHLLCPLFSAVPAWFPALWSDHPSQTGRAVWGWQRPGSRNWKTATETICWNATRYTSLISINNHFVIFYKTNYYLNYRYNDFYWTAISGQALFHVMPFQHLINLSGLKSTTLVTLQASSTELEVTDNLMQGWPQYRVKINDESDR